ncbi:GNAT family N-acetyltransferase [Lentibacter sp. XHP0401]|nr:GNAT family N-acetyltransferase [Lentibacter sp. XHP0401]
MQTFEKGAYRVRGAECAADVKAAQALRHRAFFGCDGLEQDSFDDTCLHVLIEARTGALVGCFRLMRVPEPSMIAQSYSAQFYELSALQSFNGPMLELGRFCLAPEVSDPDVVRIAWAALTRYVDDNNIKMLFGCASFAGRSPDPYLDSFAVLKARHLAPEPLQPKVKAPEVFRFVTGLCGRPDLKHGMAQMPPLLRSYLAMGGWVSDHAVIDVAMGTLHVFTALEVEAIPAARKRLLRATVA